MIVASLKLLLLCSSLCDCASCLLQGKNIPCTPKEVHPIKPSWKIKQVTKSGGLLFEWRHTLNQNSESPTETLTVRHPVTTRNRLRHDAAQLKYILEKGIIPSASPRRDTVQKAAHAYNAVISQLNLSSQKIFAAMATRSISEGNTMAYTEDQLDQGMVSEIVNLKVNADVH